MQPMPKASIAPAVRFYSDTWLRSAIKQKQQAAADRERDVAATSAAARWRCVMCSRAPPPSLTNCHRPCDNMRASFR